MLEAYREMIKRELVHQFSTTCILIVLSQCSVSQFHSHLEEKFLFCNPMPLPTWLCFCIYRFSAWCVSSIERRDLI